MPADPYRPRVDTTGTDIRRYPSPPAATDALTRTAVTKTLRPGQPGTARWQALHGDRLVCVRYREDVDRHQRHVTLELVAETRAMRPSARQRKTGEAGMGLSARDDEVAVRIAYGETRQRALAKQAGARWDPATQRWYLRRSQAEQLGWQDRIVRP